jgi:DNA-binding NtrC family response regulator
VKKGSILIVDDNEAILKSLHLLLKPEFLQIDTSKSPERIPALMEATAYDLYLLDMNFRTGINTGNEGLFWLKKILKKDPEAIIIMITAYGDVNLAVKAIKSGATDFIQKPWDADKLIVTLQSAFKLRQSRKEIVQLRLKESSLNEKINQNRNEIIGSSAAMKTVFSMIDKVAKTDANVLILGENGTGKELIARQIHLQSKRANNTFVALDMGSISDGLFESELFGHQKGSFTDASSQRIGKIETAQGGTLFLDEIANLPYSMQAKILRVLQERKIVPLGSNQTKSVDIRLICATNKAIRDLIGQNLFREDLYFRINTIEIEIPPLRERKNDIVELAEYFLSKYSRKYEKPKLKMDAGAIQKLNAHNWPGNVRELKHSIEKAVILSGSNILTNDDFPFKSYHPVNEKERRPQKIQEIEKESIRENLILFQGNLSKVARELEMSRTTLYKKIKRYGL